MDRESIVVKGVPRCARDDKELAALGMTNVFKGEGMDENNSGLASSAERLAAAADALEKVLGRIEASQQELHTKVDRIIAAIEEQSSTSGAPSSERDGAGTPGQGVSAAEGSAEELNKRLAEIERENAELKAQAGRLARKTLSPLVSGLLSKNGVEETGAAIEAGVLEKALAALSLEQRITVKAELARAGMIA